MLYYYVININRERKETPGPCESLPGFYGSCMSELQGPSQVSRRREKFISYDVCRKAVAEFEFASLWTCQSFDALELLDPWTVRLSPTRVITPKFSVFSYSKILKLLVLIVL